MCGIKCLKILAEISSPTLHKAISLVPGGEPALKTIVRELASHVRKSVTIDWTLRESAQAEIRVLVRRILRKHGYGAAGNEGKAESAGRRRGKYSVFSVQF